jgi:hypothetical protein
MQFERQSMEYEIVSYELSEQSDPIANGPSKLSFFTIRAATNPFRHREALTAALEARSSLIRITDYPRSDVVYVVCPLCTLCTKCRKLNILQNSVLSTLSECWRRLL